MPYKQTSESEMKNCADLCLECSTTCTETIGTCLGLGGEHSARDHITLLQICSDICQVSARALLLGSEFHEHTCRACAEICEACAIDCESMEGAFMEDCADICFRCAESCRNMSGDSEMEKAA